MDGWTLIPAISCIRKANSTTSIGWNKRIRTYKSVWDRRKVRIETIKSGDNWEEFGRFDWEDELDTDGLASELLRIGFADWTTKQSDAATLVTVGDALRSSFDSSVISVETDALAFFDWVVDGEFRFFGTVDELDWDITDGEICAIGSIPLRLARVNHSCCSLLDIWFLLFVFNPNPSINNFNSAKLNSLNGGRQQEPNRANKEEGGPTVNGQVREGEIVGDDKEAVVRARWADAFVVNDGTMWAGVGEREEFESIGRQEWVGFDRDFWVVPTFTWQRLFLTISKLVRSINGIVEVELIVWSAGVDLRTLAGRQWAGLDKGTEDEVVWLWSEDALIAEWWTKECESVFDAPAIQPSSSDRMSEIGAENEIIDRADNDAVAIGNSEDDDDNDTIAGSVSAAVFDDDAIFWMAALWRSDPSSSSESNSMIDRADMRPEVAMEDEGSLRVGESDDRVGEELRDWIKEDW